MGAIAHADGDASARLVGALPCSSVDIDADLADRPGDDDDDAESAGDEDEEEEEEVLEEEGVTAEGVVGRVRRGVDRSVREAR